MIAALVLAAGESRRMGEPKLLLRHAGRTLLELALEKAQRVSDLALVVLGAHSEAYGPLARAAGAAVVMNPGWREGLASSLRAGVAALPPEAEAALVVLPDQPFVPLVHLRALLECYFETRAPLVLSRYLGADVLGVPGVVDRSLFGALQSLQGEQGAKRLAARSAYRTVPLAQAEDVDSPSDARRLLGDA